MAEKGGKTSQGLSKVIWIVVVTVVVLLIVGGLALYLISRPESETEIASTLQPSSTASKGKALPSRDVLGVDLEVAPRYPDSVRTAYSEGEDDSEKVTYQTKDSIDEVKAYYNDRIPALGWQAASSEEDQITFRKEAARLYVWLDYNKTDQITTYELRYFPQ